jgi:hypothetical protein
VLISREYTRIEINLARAREEHETRARVRGLRGQAARRYPEALRENMPEFADWLSQYVEQRVTAGDDLDIELRRLSHLPSRRAETYKQMWAFGNHYRVLEHENENGYVTSDFGLASTFGGDDAGGPGAVRFGILKEIIVVRYSARRWVVMRGHWIRGGEGIRPAMKEDEYGFQLVRYNDRDRIHQEPYVLPSTVRQVCLN